MYQCNCHAVEGLIDVICISDVTYDVERSAHMETGIRNFRHKLSATLLQEETSLSDSLGDYMSLSTNSFIHCGICDSLDLRDCLQYQSAPLASQLLNEI